jgi:hypothetical protein
LDKSSDSFLDAPEKSLVNNWDRYESIETLAVKLNQPKLYTMSSKGITTEDIAQVKYNEAQAYGFTTDEYGTLKTYLKNHKMKTEPSAISTSPVSAGGKMNLISKGAPLFMPHNILCLYQSKWLKEIPRLCILERFQKTEGQKTSSIVLIISPSVWLQVFAPVLLLG